MAGPAGLPMPKKYLPNWALAAVLGGFVGGTYWYTMHAVGKDDLQQELDREAQRLAKEAPRE